ncbi:hypothetical protein JMA_37940 (plasmid) [Jeotgalibacillus malaysiensis]|uniref:Uncharacterized protein n=1 Tax=Jeotgalibacillus malaysiensis TaxID=1508404 RepID=A0A0B5AWM3_9BACL|nr:hypothetical protein [Jeotgalibacillus malaysiensis]AJD93112.1 hypothetical protein JMA_37940 [Jeotgalibacillus malaysiensis]
MTQTVWSKGDLKIIYSNPFIQGFEENAVCTSMNDYLYFYYDVTVMNREKTLFSSRIGTAPLVHQLPAEIDRIIGFDMEKALVTADIHNNTWDVPFHRLTKFAMVSLDADIRNDYYYKIEREDNVVNDDGNLDEWTSYTLSIGNTGEYYDDEKTPQHGQVVEIRGLTESDLIALKETALTFCKDVLKAHEEEKKGGMRSMTGNELKSYNTSLNKQFKPTGINLWEGK